MMGHRGKLSGSEWDAFSRKSRHLMRWRPGKIKALKRAFAKRMRQSSETHLQTVEHRN